MPDMSTEETDLLLRLVRAGEGLRFWIWVNGMWFDCNVLQWWAAKERARAVCRARGRTANDGPVAMRTRRVKAVG